VPVFSWLATFGAGARRTVPALITPEATIPDSTDILRWVDAQPGAERLFPDEHPEVATLEQQFDERLGVDARVLVYFHALSDEAGLKSLMRASGPAWESAATAVVYPLIRTVIVRALGVHADGAARARRRVDQTYAEVGARLSDGRRYLCGDRFTAADLTFASLAYLVVWPEDVARIAMPYESVPPSMRAVIEEQRATPAGRFALRLWDEERRRA
jgi:glutathione S-transferase